MQDSTNHSQYLDKEDLDDFDFEAHETKLRTADEARVLKSIEQHFRLFTDPEIIADVTKRLQVIILREPSPEEIDRALPDYIKQSLVGALSEVYGQIHYVEGATEALASAGELPTAAAIAQIHNRAVLKACALSIIVDLIKNGHRDASSLKPGFLSAHITTTSKVFDSDGNETKPRPKLGKDEWPEEITS